MYDSGLGHPWLNPEGTFKVFCEADEGLCLAVRGGALVLAATDPADEHQHWFKDVRFSLRIKDEEGKPVFSLINKATGLAVQHSLGAYHPVRLLKFDPEGFEESVLWTESGHLGREFGRIRMMHDVDLALDAALPRNKDGSGVRDGTAITLTEGADGDTRSWKIVSWSDEANKTCAGLCTEPTCRIYCRAGEGFNLTVRDGAVCLAPADVNDEYQHWIQDKRPGNRIKDIEGYPAFVLVNKVTGDAIDASVGMGNPLKLKAYNPCYLDEFILWANNRDMGDGFRCIHMLCNISLNFNAFQVDKDNGGSRMGVWWAPAPRPGSAPPRGLSFQSNKGRRKGGEKKKKKREEELGEEEKDIFGNPLSSWLGPPLDVGVQDGDKLLLSCWSPRQNLHLQWKIVPWCKFSL